MNDVRKQMDSGEAHPSTARKALEKQAESGLTDLETAYALSSPFTAGVGTVSGRFHRIFCSKVDRL